MKLTLVKLQEQEQAPLQAPPLMSSEPSPTASEPVLSVSDLTRAMQRTLEQGFASVVVRGEISNFVQHASGHRYFTLKDGSAQLKAVMWRSTPLRFTPTNGMNVIARGGVTLYPPSGAAQIECRSLEMLGQGDVQLAFEALKKALYERGWFDAARKRPLPRFPLKIGVATSQTGAAIRDITATVARRMPLCEILLRPTLVQGEGAPEDLVAAIGELNQTDCDVLIVGRGGGSVEDLWAFNDERVAEAILHSRLPVISAVGHEIDVTIADYVADVRAATPTAAAELAVRDAQELLAMVGATQEYLRRSVTALLEQRKRAVEQFARHSALRRVPEHIQRSAQQVDDATTRLHLAVQRGVAAKRQRYEAVAAHCASLHPLAPLKRGFAMLERDGKSIHAAERLAEGEHVTVVRENQQVQVLVEKEIR
jgi:exodeoxyribonuclease VII large subunit